MPPVDVVIVGAGVAGLTAARLLHRQGLALLVLRPATASAAAR